MKISNILAVAFTAASILVSSGSAMLDSRVFGLKENELRKNLSALYKATDKAISDHNTKTSELNAALEAARLLAHVDSAHLVKAKSENVKGAPNADDYFVFAKADVKTKVNAALDSFFSDGNLAGGVMFNQDVDVTGAVPIQVDYPATDIQALPATGSKAIVPAVAIPGFVQAVNNLNANTKSAFKTKIEAVIDSTDIVQCQAVTDGGAAVLPSQIMTDANAKALVAAFKTAIQHKIAFYVQLCGQHGGRADSDPMTVQATVTQVGNAALAMSCEEFAEFLSLSAVEGF